MDWPLEKIKMLFYLLVMLFLITGNQLTKNACYNGIMLCLNAVIPSLFPFFCISGPLLTLFLQSKNRLLSKIGKLCGLPAGCEGILIIGLLGGYPLGAKAVAEAVESHALMPKDAQRMLAFCNNCGPAFLFGMISPLFPSLFYALTLWLIHVISAICVALLIPGKSQNTVDISQLRHKKTEISSAISAMASVCGWVILFRIVTESVSQLIFRNQISVCGIVLTGFVEITNGIVLLADLESLTLRFLLSGMFLNFGGICVLMQTGSVIGKLRIDTYILGKLIQLAISTLLSLLFCITFIGRIGVYELTITAVTTLFGCLSFFLCWKKAVVIQENLMYNTSKKKEMGLDHAVS